VTSHEEIRESLENKRNYCETNLFSWDRKSTIL